MKVRKLSVFAAAAAVLSLALSANAGTVSTKTATGWTATYTPTSFAYNDPGTTVAATVVKDNAPNSAWTGGAAVATFANSGVLGSNLGFNTTAGEWIGVNVPAVSTTAPNTAKGIISYSYDLGLTAVAGDVLKYGIAFTADNRVLKIKIVSSSSTTPIYEFNLASFPIAPGSGDSFYREFQSSTVLPTLFNGTNPGSVTPTPLGGLSLLVEVYNETNQASTGPTSPSGFSFAGNFSIESGANPIPLPPAALAGIALMGTLVVRRFSAR